MARSKNVNGKDIDREVVTIIRCARSECDVEVVIPCKKGFWGYKMADYPNSFKNVEGRWVCSDCKKVFEDWVKNDFMNGKIGIKPKKNIKSTG